MVGIGIGVNAKVVAGLHPVQFAAATVDGTDIQTRGMAAPFCILGTGRVAGAAFVLADAPIPALAQTAWALAAARDAIELFPALAWSARAVALARPLVAVETRRAWRLRATAFLVLTFAFALALAFRLGERIRGGNPAQDRQG